MTSQQPAQPVQNFSNHIFFIDEVKIQENTHGSKKPVKHVNVECEHGISFTVDASCTMTFCGICLRDKQPAIFLRHLNDNDIRLFPEECYRRLQFSYDRAIKIFKQIRCTYIMCQHCEKTYQGNYLKNHMRTMHSDLYVDAKGECEKCPSCDKYYVKRTYYEKHIKRCTTVQYESMALTDVSALINREQN